MVKAYGEQENGSNSSKNAPSARDIVRTDGCALEARFVAAQHEQFFENLFAGGNFLFFAFFGLGLEVLAGAGFGYDEVPVALALELPIRIFKRIARADDNSWHTHTPFLS